MSEAQPRRRGPNSRPLSEKLWSKVEKSDGCWIWTGGLGQYGQPSMQVDYRTRSVRRLVWELTHGAQPDPKLVMSTTCGESKCVRPDHLVARDVSPEALFWSKVKMGDAPNDCWVWTGATYGTGYGYLRAGKRQQHRAHRFSYELHYGPIVGHGPDNEICVLHRCDNPPCVRPDHLFLGSDADNIADMTAKGRAGWQKARANMQRLAEKAMRVPPDDTGC